MSYFDEVYVKRMNIDGRTQQERTKTRKEKEFDKLFLKKTMYQSVIYQVNERSTNFFGSLQPNKWNESELISNLLVSTKLPKLKTGDILKIRQKIKEMELNKIWLIIFVEDNLSNGYQTYKVICLDSEINITDEYGNTKYLVPVKFVSSTSQLVKDYFSFSGTTKGYREPDKDSRMITRDFDFLIKDVYFNYKERGWEISGKDNISIENVAYISISERLVHAAEPISSKDLPVSEDDNFFLINR